MNQPNNIMEAYELTMETVRQLRVDGIEVDISLSLSSVKQGMLDKYSKNLPPCFWSHVTLKPTSKEEACKIQEKQEELRQYGISFDSGGGCGGRDWEIDWSFGLNPVNSKHIQDVETSQTIVNKLMDELNIDGFED